MSASNSMSSFSLYLLYKSSSSKYCTAYSAPESFPLIVSPGKNPSWVEPMLTLDTLSIFVSLAQPLTLASVLDLSPTTTSLKRYVPRPLSASGSPIVTVGALLYPLPGSAT